MKETVRGGGRGGKGGLAIILGMLYAKETGISSVCLGFWLTLTLILTYQKHLSNLVPRVVRSIFYGKSPGDEVDC